jgi:hypothetical protein
MVMLQMPHIHCCPYLNKEYGKGAEGVLEGGLKGLCVCPTTPDWKNIPAAGGHITQLHVWKSVFDWGRGEKALCMQQPVSRQTHEHTAHLVMRKPPIALPRPAPRPM